MTLGQSTIDSLQFFAVLALELAALFIVVSALVALLQIHVPASRVQAVLTGSRGRGNIIAAGFGAATPFCGCSTIPLLVGLLNAGAPFGPSMSYLIASPILNPVVIGLFWLAFGWQVTAVYALFAFTLAVLAGIAWENLGLSRHLRPMAAVPGGAKCGESSCSPPAETGSDCDTSPSQRSGESERLLPRLLRTAWQQFRDFMPYMLIGAAIGALIYGFVPEGWITRTAGPDNPWSIPLAALIGIPLYVRSDTMVPIGLALVEQGMGIGAVMSLILAGAGASIPEVILLGRLFRPPLLATFLITILAIAIGAGVTVQSLFG